MLTRLAQSCFRSLPPPQSNQPPPPPLDYPPNPDSLGERPTVHQQQLYINALTMPHSSLEQPVYTPPPPIKKSKGDQLAVPYLT
jgi:hypothetical protein